MYGYAVDHLALGAGLAASGDEHERRELSRLLSDALGGGPFLEFPALCVAAAERVRSGLADHLAEIVIAAQPGSVTVPGLSLTAQLSRLRVMHPALGWPATHAAALALAWHLPIMTTDPGAYDGVAVDVIPL